MNDTKEIVSLCACMGPIGDDAYCPCRMRANGLTPTEIWTPQAKAELRAALGKIFQIEEKMKEAQLQ